MRARLGRALAVAVASVLALGGLVAPASAAAVPSSFTFTGSGWGHGLGMSQYGAYGQALAGRSSTQILEHYYAPAKVTTTSTDPVLRVQVLRKPGQVTVTKGTAGSWRLRNPNGMVETVTTTSITFTYNSTGRVSAKFNGKTWGSGTAVASRFVLEWTGTRSWSGTEALVTVPGANGGSKNVTYRHGRLTFGPLAGQLNVANETRLSDYLYGLAEMPSSWPGAALQAQAIAGRTYALRKHAEGIKTKVGNRWVDAHLTDETWDQKFTAWNKQNETTYGKRWVAAVDATQSSSSARVVTYGGKLITTFYSSSSGGRTNNSEDVWGGANLPYLRSQDDRWAVSSAVKNPYASWTATKTQSQVATVVGLPDVARLTVAKRATSGAVMQVRATSSSGRSVLYPSTPTTDGVRTAFGLRSAYFELGALLAVERLAGSDRYETAVAIGRAAFPSSSEVVLVSGAQGNLVDGLVAAPFARDRKAPVLIATRDGLPTATAAELDRRRPTTVWLVGGTGVLGSKLVTQLKDRGAVVKRLAGDDRYETSAQVALRMGAASTVVLASGAPRNIVDAAAAGGPAAAAGYPVVLTRPELLSDSAADAIAQAGATSVVVAGGPGAVSAGTVDTLQARDTGLKISRVHGKDRFATAAALASHFERTVGSDTVLVASGRDANLVDVLTGGVLGHVTLLTNGSSLPTVTRSWFAAREVPLIRVAGGTGVVPNSVVDAIR